MRLSWIQVIQHSKFIKKKYSQSTADRIDDDWIKEGNFFSSYSYSYIAICPDEKKLIIINKKSVYRLVAIKISCRLPSRLLHCKTKFCLPSFRRSSMNTNYCPISSWNKYFQVLLLMFCSTYTFKILTIVTRTFT